MKPAKAPDNAVVITAKVVGAKALKEFKMFSLLEGASKARERLQNVRVMFIYGRNLIVVMENEGLSNSSWLGGLDSSIHAVSASILTEGVLRAFFEMKRSLPYPPIHVQTELKRTTFPHAMRLLIDDSKRRVQRDDKPDYYGSLVYREAKLVDNVSPTGETFTNPKVEWKEVVLKTYLDTAIKTLPPLLASDKELRRDVRQAIYKEPTTEIQ